jgi:hypothetical protein
MAAKAVIMKGDKAGRRQGSKGSEGTDHEGR